MKIITIKKLQKLSLLLFACLSYLGSYGQNPVVLVPYTGNNTVENCTDVTLKDHAGDSNYSNHANGYTVLEAANNAVINIAGNYQVESNFDFIRIYDGAGIGGALLQTFTGGGAINFTGAPGQTLTVRFTSDSSVVQSGFDLAVTYTGCTVDDDAGIGAINLAPSFCAQTEDISVELKNFGTNNISSADIEWEINGTSQTPVAFSGTLAPDASTTVVLASNFNFTNGTYVITARTNNPNNTTDGNTSNDELERTINVGAFPPTNITHTEVTANDVYSISWTGDNTQTYELEYGSFGFTQGTGTTISNITGTSQNISGIDPSINGYDVYVRSYCGSTPSNWSFVYTFGVAPSTIYANSSTGDDSNDGLTPPTAKKTFTAAYNAADADDIIDLTGTFTWTDAGEVTSTTSGFTINKNIEIRGQGINQTIIQANSAYNTADRRVFTINTGVNASFSELTIRNGKTTEGGAILNSGALSISKCNFINNIGANGGGGAIKQNNTAAVLTVNQSIFQLNIARSGGAVEDHTINSNSEMYITNSIFFSNTQTATSATVGGAGIRVIATTGKTVITNCTFTKNNLSVGTGNGAGIFVRDGNLHLKNNIFSGNTRGGDPLPAGRNDLYNDSGTIVDNGGNIFDRINTAQFTVNNNSWYQTTTTLDGIFKLHSDQTITGELFLDGTLEENGTTNGVESIALLDVNSIAFGNAVLGSNDVILQTDIDIRDEPRSSTVFGIGAFELDGNPCAPFAAEAPTLDNGVYQISTFNHLRWISENSNSWGADFIQTADIEAVITSDNCYNSGVGWSPIGNVSTKFTGSYDGDGHSISNLFINRPNNQRIALFGETNGATIQNLGLIDPDITVTGTGQSGMGSNVGSLVGLADNGTTISECFATGGSVIAGGSGVGGLIGQLLGSSLTNSYAIVAVEGGDAGVNYSAGLVGVNSSSTITNCYAAGSVAFKQNSGITLSRGLTQGSNGITNSFYDSDATGQTTGGGTAKTTAEMKQQATFTNWDFQCEAANGTANIWGIDEGNDYPRLSWEGFTQDCTVQWTGTVSSDWNTAGNWSNQEEPNIFSIPVITNVANQPTTANNIEVAALQINSGSSLTMQALASLKVNGNITNNGQITFKSDSSGDAYFDTFTGSLTGTGDVVVEKYYPAKRAFRMVTSPVNSTTSIYDNWQNGGNNIAGIGTHITGSATGANGFDQTETGNPSLFYFDNGWQSVANTNTTNLTAATPYRLMVRGDRNVDLSENNATPNPTTLISTGTLEVGTISFTFPSATTTDNPTTFAFIANPYQSRIDVSEVLTANSSKADATRLWVWDPMINTRGGFVTIDELSGNGDTTPSSDATKFIEPGQAFFIQLSGTNSEISFTESVKDVTTTLDKSAPFSDNQMSLLFELQNEGNQVIDAIRLRFAADGDNGVDNLDAGKMGNLDENLASVNENSLFTIQRRSFPENDEVIPLFTNNWRNENYSFKANLANFEDTNVYLVDNYLGTETLLENGEVYNFSVDAGISDSTNLLRFELKFDTISLGVEEVNNNLFSLYPNPAKEVVNIQTSLALGTSVEVEIYNMLGQQVYTAKQELKSPTLEVDVNAFISGVYIVKLTDEAGNKQSTQLIKE